MASHTKVLNISSNCRIKRSQALNRIDQGLSAWVENKKGFEIRDLSPAERIAFRSEQAKTNQSLALSEIPGIKWEPPASGIAYENTRRQLLHQANEFCSQTHLPIINPTDVTLNIARHNAKHSINN